jgi:hypothetical protein
MEIDNVKTLVRQIRSLGEDDAQRLLVSYGNKREEKGINEGWTRCRMLWSKSIRMRTKRLRDHILDYDEYTAQIEIPEFILYVSSIADELKKVMMNGSDETRHAAADLFDFMYNKIGNVKTDRRRILPLLDRED